MQYELRVNGYPVTHPSVIRKGMATAPDGTTGWFVYEWNAWRVDPEKPSAGILHYAAGEVVHRYWDGIEELAIKVLGEYRQAVHPERSGLTEV